MAKYRRDTPYHKRFKPVHEFIVSTHPLYQVWNNMIGRCCNPDNGNYANYGGRGIAVCADWRHSFERFALDMGMPPSDLHSLDRINNELSYCKENCRWASRSEQMHNRRKFKSNTTGFTGVVAAKNGRFSARYDDDKDRYRLGNFGSAQEAAAYRDIFIAILAIDKEAAMLMTERRARYDSATGVRGISAHSDGGFIVRKTIGGVRKYLGYRKTFDEALELWSEHN